MVAVKIGSSLALLKVSDVFASAKTEV